MQPQFNVRADRTFMPTLADVPVRFDGEHHGSSAMRSRLSLALLACALVMATSGVANATTANGANAGIGIRAIESAYHDLVRELVQSRGARLDSTTRRRIVTAAQTFQGAIQRDGGARSDLEMDAKNIVVSLGDGSFNADASINVLQRDAKGSVIDVGPWDQASMGGAPIADAIGTHLNQTSEGDCVGISVVKAFSNTEIGAAILRRAVTANPDGSYNVNLPGDPSTIYHVDGHELEQYGKGDPPAAAVVGAMFRYFHLSPKTSSLPTNKVMELLAGGSGDHARLADSETTAQGITDFLIRNADGVGSRVAMVFGGKTGRNGEWTKGDGHAFAVMHIDPSTGILT